MDLAQLRNVGYTVVPGVVVAELIAPLLAELTPLGRRLVGLDPYD